jgi:uncharacterized protein YoxC
METWQIILLVLVALLAVPGMLALLELRKTLKELRVFLQDTGGRVNQTLDEARAALHDLNRASAAVQQGADRLRELAENLAGFGSAVNSISAGIRRISDGLVHTVIDGLGSLFRRDKHQEETGSEEPEGKAAP